MVAVYGSLGGDGSLKIEEVHQLTTSNYVPGATQLYLKGRVTSVDYANAVARIGSLSVNYTGALHTLAAESLVAERRHRSPEFDSLILQSFMLKMDSLSHWVRPAVMVKPAVI